MLPWCSISSSFQNSLRDVWASRLWVSGVLVLEFGPILPWYRFPAAAEFCGRLMTYFLLDAPNVLYRWKIWLQAGQFSTWTLLLRSHAVVIAAVCSFALSCWNTQGLPWNTRHLEGSICCNLTLRNVVFKVFHNLFTHSFTDWRASTHLYFWETLPL